MLPIVHEAWSLPRMNIKFLSRVLSPFELELPVYLSFGQDLVLGRGFQFTWMRHSYWSPFSFVKEKIKFRFCVWSSKTFIFFIYACFGPMYDCLELENAVFQTLDIVAENPDKFRVVGLAAGSNVTLLVDQVFCEPDLSLQDNNPSRSTHLICEGLELMCFSFIL